MIWTIIFFVIVGSVCIYLTIEAFEWLRKINAIAKAKARQYEGRTVYVRSHRRRKKRD